MFKKFVGAGVLLGLLIPCLVFLKVSVTKELAGMYEFLLWPSSIVLMANEQYGEGDPMIWVNWAISVLANVVWYTILASLVYAMHRALGTRRSG